MTTTVVIFGEKFPCSSGEDDSCTIDTREFLKGTTKNLESSLLFSSNCTDRTEENTSFADYTDAPFDFLSLEDEDDHNDDDRDEEDLSSKQLVEAIGSNDAELGSRASTLSGSSRQRRDRSTGVPQEIIVFGDTTSPAGDDGLDLITKLELAECMVSSYKEALNNTERVVESLRSSLREARINAEGLFEERNSLLSTIRDLEEAETERSCQFSFVKLIMCFGLFVYMCGGSESLLIVAAVLFLLHDILCKYV